MQGAQALDYRSRTLRLTVVVGFTYALSKVGREKTNSFCSPSALSSSGSTAGASWTSLDGAPWSAEVSRLDRRIIPDESNAAAPGRLDGVAAESTSNSDRPEYAAFGGSAVYRRRGTHLDGSERYHNTEAHRPDRRVSEALLQHPLGKLASRAKVKVSHAVADGGLRKPRELRSRRSVSPTTHCLKPPLFK